MFELKWVKNNQNKEAKKLEAIEQLKNYKTLDGVKEIDNLYSYTIIGSKDEVEFIKV